MTRTYTEVEVAAVVQAERDRGDVRADRAYLSGMKTGWNRCVADDEAGFQGIVEKTRREIREAVAVLKAKRDAP